MTRQRHAPFLVISQLNRTCPATGQALLELSLKLFLLPTPLGFPLLFPTSNYNHQNSNIISKITICLSLHFLHPFPSNNFCCNPPFCQDPKVKMSEPSWTFLQSPGAVPTIPSLPTSWQILFYTVLQNMGPLLPSDSSAAMKLHHCSQNPE